jgi:hypothetical protein
MSELPDVLRLDNPESPDRTRLLGGILAEAVRALNYATLGDVPGLEFPADADALLGNLALAVMRLPQLLGQVVAWLQDQNAAGRVEVRHGEHRGDPIGAVAVTGVALMDACHAAGQLQAALDAARKVTATLGAPFSAGEDGNA